MKTLWKHLDYQLFSCEVWTAERIQIIWFRRKSLKYLNQQILFLLKSSELLLFNLFLWSTHHGHVDHFKICWLWQSLQCSPKKKKNVTTLSRSKLQNYKPPVLFTINTNTHLHSKPFNLFVTKPFMPGIQSHIHLQIFFTADYHPALARSLLNLPGQTHPHFTDTYPPPPHLYPHWSLVFLTTSPNTNGALRDLFSATRLRLKGLSVFGLLQFCSIWSRMLWF